MSVEDDFRSIIQEEIASKNNWTIIDVECWTWTSKKCLYGAAILDAGTEYKAFIVRNRKGLKIEPVASIPKSTRIISCSGCWSVIDGGKEYYFYNLNDLIRYLGKYLQASIRSRNARFALMRMLDAIAEKGSSCPCGGEGSSPLDKWLSWDDIKRELARAYCCGYLGDCTQKCINYHANRTLIVIIPKDHLPDTSSTIYAELHGTPPKAYAILLPALAFNPEEADSVPISEIHVFSLDFRYRKVLRRRDWFYMISLRELRSRKDIALYILPNINDVLRK